MKPNQNQQKKSWKQVVPYIGTWIETGIKNGLKLMLMVVPYIGTWIETQVASDWLPSPGGSYLI